MLIGSVPVLSGRDHRHRLRFERPKRLRRGAAQTPIARGGGRGVAVRIGGGKADVRAQRVSVLRCVHVCECVCVCV